MQKKVLVIGGGGREHAVTIAFLKSELKPKVFVLPGNAGTEEIAFNVTGIDIKDHQKIIEFCKKEQIDLVFIGPEQPLVDGLVDDLTLANIKVFGPSKGASQLEGSKIFMKNLVEKNSIPTADFKIFTDLPLALAHISKAKQYPLVIKTDGLAAGKGVVIAKNQDEAITAIGEFFNGKFGEAGKKIIIEEFLDGFEVSYFVICDGKNFLPLGFAHDHKKIGENDTGLNTGGMGAFSPSPFINKNIEEKVIRKIILPTIRAMEKSGNSFSGILFAGLMIAKDEPKLLEYNIRFGDPETQVMLPTIKSDFFELIDSAVNKTLNNFKLELHEGLKAVCLVVSALGYPLEYQNGTVITLPKNLNNDFCGKTKLQNADSYILHAGTVKDKNGVLLSNGGRVLNIVATATNFKDAIKCVYEVAENINWPNGYFRKDIAKRAINF
jgi:phosphoribosylamine--glycine ligase